MNLIWKLLRKKKTGPLPFEEIVESRGTIIVAAGLTDKGRIADQNQDALFLLNAAISQNEDLLPLGLYIVADGVGGHQGGAQASALAVRLIANWVLDRIYQPFLADSTPSSNQQPINQVLREAALAANGQIHEACGDGGTTLTCAFVLGTNAFIAHVGDSRAYLIGKNSIRQITTDHSLVNRLVELGQITPEEAKVHPQRHVLYRVLGRAGSLDIDTYLQSLPSHSSLLLCSDGLWQMVPPEEILATVNAAPTPHAACHRLIARANERGGEDNTTAIVVQVKS